MTVVLAALAILASGAAGALGLARRPHAALAVSLASIVVAGVLCCAAGVRVLLGGSAFASTIVQWPLPIGSATFALDGLSAWFLLVIGIVSTAVAVYSWDYFRTELGRAATWAATALLNVLVAALVITVCAGDVILFLLGWELMSLSAFLLVGFHHRDPRVRRGAWMYLVATHLGTALGVLPVFGAFVASTGSTAFAGFAGAIEPSQTGLGTTLFLLGLVGFGTKAGLMPLHVWLPEAHPVAPSPVSALMSGIVIKTGIYGLIRLLTWLPPLPRPCAVAVIAIAAVTGVLAILWALAQRQYKRMLAYSSIENIGIIALGVGVGMLGRAAHVPALAVLGFGGALLHVLNHALFKGLLFLSAGAVLHSTGEDNLERLGGLARGDPLNAGFFAWGCVAICGLPPLNGFVGEFLIYSGLMQGAMSGSLMVTAFALVGVAALALIGGLALAAFSKLFGVIFLGEPRAARVRTNVTPPSMLAGMAILAIGCIVVSLGARTFSGLLEAPLTVVAETGSDARAALDAMLAALTAISLLSMVGLGIAGLLIVIRSRMRSPQLSSERPVTWGCGYSAPTARMQYSGSSYIWKLADSFRGVLRAERRVRRPAGCFAQPASLEMHAADLAVTLAYEPTFRAAARGCERLWPLQHGRVHLYLMYIVATLLIVFAIEACLSPFAAAGSGATAAASRPAARMTEAAHGGPSSP